MVAIPTKSGPRAARCAGERSIKREQAMKTPIKAPWIVGWTHEDVTEVRSCPYAGGRRATWAPDRQGEGHPNFRHLHPVRARKAVAADLCISCGRPLRKDRYMFPLGSWMMSPRGWVFILFGGMVHRGCAKQAQILCPAIRRSHAEPRRASKTLGMHTDLEIVFGESVANLNRYMISEQNAVRLFGDAIPHREAL